MDYVDLIRLVAFGAIAQFIAAILGPNWLKVATTLLVIAALSAVAFLSYSGVNGQFAGMSADDQSLAIDFGALAALLIATHLGMRSMFRCMARCSAA